MFNADRYYKGLCFLLFVTISLFFYSSLDNDIELNVDYVLNKFEGIHVYIFIINWALQRFRSLENVSFSIFLVVTGVERNMLRMSFNLMSSLKWL